MILRKLFNRATPAEKPVGDRLWLIPQKPAGVAVDHDRALQFSAVFAAIRVIADTVAGLPWHVYRRTLAGWRERTPGVLEYLLNTRPNPEVSSFHLRQTLLAHALTWGNGYAEIERDLSGRVSALYPISPDRVEVTRDPSGRLIYRITGSTGQTELQARDVFHLHGLGFDGITGYSVVGLAARAIGLGIAAEQFGASFYGNNTILGGVLQHPGKLSDQAYARLRDSWEGRFGGSANAFRPAVLEEGMKWDSLGMPLEDAQFLESRKFQVEEIARWFRVPPHKLGDLSRSTYSNIEHQAIEFVQDTIYPWCRLLELEADEKLIGVNNASSYTRINLNGLLRADVAARANYYREMRNIGVLSVNEIRALEDLDPIGPDGDKYVIQMNMTTLERIGEEAEPAPAVPPRGSAPEADDDEPMNLTVNVAPPSVTIHPPDIHIPIQAAPPRVETPVHITVEAGKPRTVRKVPVRDPITNLITEIREEEYDPESPERQRADDVGDAARSPESVAETLQE